MRAMSFDRTSRLLRPGASPRFGSGLGFALLAWAALVAPMMHGRAAGVRLLDSAVVFAGLEEARSVLTNRDGFVAALSPFDRAARLKVDREVSETEFLAHLAASARAWAAQETNELHRACLRIAGQLAGWHVPLPSTVLFIKTSGAEEGHAAYTRQHAVILPQSLLDQGKGTVPDELLLHELFHIVSRHDPALRRRLYDQIGFLPIPAVDYPPALRDRKITNPDGYEILADNFVLLIQGRTNVASPALLEALGTLLRPAAQPAPAP